MTLLQQIQEIDLDTAMKIVGWIAGGMFAMLAGGVPLLHKLGFWKWIAGKCHGIVAGRRRLALTISNLQTSMEQTSGQLSNKVDTLAENQQKIQKQLEPNGGSSMRDSIDQINRIVGYLQAKSRHQDDTDPEPKFELDARGNLVYANCAFCTLVNADEKELGHMDWAAHIAQPARSRVLQELREARDNKMPLETEAPFRTGPRSVDQQPVVLNFTPRVTGSGEESELRGFFGRARAA